MIKVLSIDIWNTVLKGSVEYSLKRAEMVSSMTSLSVYMVKPIIRKVKKELIKISEETGIHFTAHEAYSILLDTLGVTPYPKLVDEIIMRSSDLFNMYPPSIMWAGWPTILDKPNNGFKVAYLSNNMFISAADMSNALRKVGMYKYADFSIFSSECGFSKPDPRIYKLLITASSTLPSYILHIGDNEETDIIGPQKLGIKTLKFDSENIDTFLTLYNEKIRS